MASQNMDATRPAHYAEGTMDALEGALDHMGLSPVEAWETGNAIKYLMRWKLKGGVGDLLKARAYVDMLVERARGMEARNGR